MLNLEAPSRRYSSKANGDGVQIVPKSIFCSDRKAVSTYKLAKL